MLARRIIMPRGNRYYIPGLIWHVTHRCHKKEFLLKFVRDRKCWLRWLYEAKKRYALTILNFTVTSNHIHLLVQDTRHRNSLSKAIQLVAGRTAQAYNIRKKRKGAFWEDRYHATAVQDDIHLIRCMLYIDLNMVRAGVASHPSEWPFCGYNEIQNPPCKYSLIDRQQLMRLLGIDDSDELRKAYNSWLAVALRKGGHARDAKWTQSIAVGSKVFIEDVKDQLGYKAIGRKIISTGDVYYLNLV
jgi:REP element-mobilizing transposase RayT